MNANVNDDAGVRVDPLGAPVDTAETVDEAPAFSTYRRDIERADIGLQVHIRIPNQFQRGKMKEEADASRARKLRDLRNPNSNAYLAIENQLDQIYGEMTDDEVRNALLSRAQPHATAKAQLEIQLADPDEHPEWVEFATVERQQHAYSRMLRAGQEDTEEFKACEAMLVDYGHALAEFVKDELEPLSNMLAGEGRAALDERLKKVLMREVCDGAFMEAYNQWQIYFGTRDPKNRHKLFYSSFDRLIDEDPERLDALLNEFVMLEALNIGEAKKALAATPS